MFTGIITDLGHVRAVHRGGDTRIEVVTGYAMSDVAIGASIACSGVCLTVVDKGNNWFAVSASAETEARTTVGEWRPGSPLNLERSLRLGDELGGHLVFGHVDGVGRIVEIMPVADSRRIVFAIPAALARYVAVKGSVAVDGVSLTVNAAEDDRVAVNIIPHTWAVTTFGAAREGDRVNLEIDMLARYVARLLEKD